MRDTGSSKLWAALRARSHRARRRLCLLGLPALLVAPGVAHASATPPGDLGQPLGSGGLPTLGQIFGDPASVIQSNPIQQSPQPNNPLLGPLGPTAATSTDPAAVGAYSPPSSSPRS